MSKIKEFGFSSKSRETGREIKKLGKLADDLGYGTYWVSEDPFYRGPFTSMATIAAHTKNIRVGTNVINPVIRHPVSIAMEMAALDDVSEGRAVLGLAAGGKSWLQDKLNLSTQKPLTTLKETIDIFQPLIRGETVSYEGDRFNIADVKLIIPPYRPKLPLYLGARSPKSLQLCGEKCDGLVIGRGAMLTPEYLSYMIENLKIGAEKSGRDISDLDITLMMTLSLSDNDREARDRVKREILKSQLQILEFGAVKFTGVLPDAFYEKLKASVDGVGNPLDLITDDIIDSYAIAGDPERCKESIAKSVEAGINSFILVDPWNYGVPVDIESLMRTFQEKVMSEFL
ncbi:LLM class flavin-dependent oxidoreductase [Porticoccaceae bacterium]|nr:LLM class flavin-dependent oxidoreductase [Porticoccaceae bacterium]